MENFTKLRVGIIGSGNIGSDLMMKIIRSDYLECAIFAGRNYNSDGMKHAISLGIPVSDLGIKCIIHNSKICDLVFDCTSAQAHVAHWDILEKLGKVVIDMTPAKLGRLCVPAINADQCVQDQSIDNINMITCGGQAAIPIAKAIADVTDDIEYIETVSSIASRSAGPATRLNLDEYIDATEKGIQKFTGIKNTKAILVLNPANPPINMQTTVYVKAKNPDLVKIKAAVDKVLLVIQKYVPKYELLVPPSIENGRIIVTVKVQGAGDYLPSYAGNLDIINCAAIDIAEKYAISSRRMG
jgi:acetaldehyde dehydrogenase (acetylating)